MATEGRKSASALLRKIGALRDKHEYAAALEKVEALLVASPDHSEARLIKAELCLAQRTQAEFVGQAALAYHESPKPGEREQAVVRGALDWAQTEMSAARKALAGRFVDDSFKEALPHLQTAQSLAPWHAGIYLAAGLAVIGFAHESANRVEGKAVPGDAGPMRWDTLDHILLRSDHPEANMTAVKQHIENPLRRARELSAPGSLLWKDATLRLAEYCASVGEWGVVDRLLAEVGEASADLQVAFDAIRVSAASGMLEEVIGTVRQLLRLDKKEDAARLLDDVHQAAPGHPKVTLLTAEAALLLGEDAYDPLARLTSTGSDETIHIDSLSAARDRAAALHLTCQRCGAAWSAGAKACAVCAFPIPTDRLLTDRFPCDGLSPQAIGRFALMQLYEERGDFQSALDLVEKLVVEIPPEHALRPLVKETGERLAPQAAAQQLAADLSRAVRCFTEGQIAEACEQLEQLYSHYGDEPDVVAWLAVVSAASQPLPERARQVMVKAAFLPTSCWQAFPAVARARLIGRLTVAGWIAEARQLLIAVFEKSELSAPKIAHLADYLHEIAHARSDQYAAESARLLDDGRLEDAVDRADAALALNPDQLDALHVRGEAYLAAGLPHLAGRSFEAILARVHDQPDRVPAGIGLARCYAALHNLEGALSVLDNLPAGLDQVKALRLQLEFQQARRPHVLAEYDSRTRHYAAVFAIALRGAARWQPTDRLSAARSDMLRAGQDFIALLGGLAELGRVPAFELRYIAWPDTVVPIRGRLEIAILCRVEHPVEESAERNALELWDRLKAHLPLASSYVYDYQPVYDEAELRSLLMPFPVEGGADILRLEAQSEGAYGVQPFTTGGTTLQNLAGMLLARSAPAMVSIHLQPTVLSSKEREMLHAQYDNLRRIDVAGAPESSILILPDGERVGLVEMLGEMRRSLEKQIYRLRVTVASSEREDVLLPYAVAAEMFGPGGQYVVETAHGRNLEHLSENLRRLEAKDWAPSAGKGQVRRLRSLTSPIEAAWVFRLPMPDVEGIPGVLPIDVKSVPPTRLPARGVIMGESAAALGGVHPPIHIQTIDRRRHQYIVGKTGVGKSTLLESMALQDIQEGHGVAVLDPHGDLIESLLSRIPAERARDVILFDPSDESQPIGLNFLEAETDSQRHRIATEFIDMLMKMYDPKQIGIVGPRFQHNVRNAMLTVMQGHPGSTLIELVRALTDISYVKHLLARVSDPMVRNYWEKQIANTADFHKSEILDYIVSKFNRFVGDRLVRNIVGQSRSTLDFRSVLNKNHILLVNLSKGKIGPESASFLGFLLLQSLLIAALSRADQPAHERKDFCLYVDEFQNFATESFMAMLSEGRKYGLCLVMANQYLSQLPPEMREAVFGNVGTLTAFQVGLQDAELLAREFYPVFSPDDLMHMPRYTAAVRLLVDGMSTRPFALRTRLAGRMPDPGLAARIHEMSRLRYGRRVETVEAEINERLRFAA